DFLSKPMRREALLEMVARHAGCVAHAADGPLVSELASDPELRELLAAFVGALPERAAALSAAVAAGDLARTAVLAHQLTGAAGGFGFPRSSVAARQLEQLVRETIVIDSIFTAIHELTGLCQLSMPSGASQPWPFCASN